MDIEKILLSENSSRIWDTIAEYVIQHPNAMNELMRLYFHEEYHRYNRATQTVGHLWDKAPDLIQPYLIEMAKFLETKPPMANKRSIMRLYQWAPIEEEVEGILYDNAIEFISSSDEPPAVKAYAMTVARRICEIHSELIPELRSMLEILLEQEISRGQQNRAEKELARLKNLEK